MLYHLVRDYCKILKTKDGKLILKCRNCDKIVYETCFFGWEKWTEDHINRFAFMESKITFHLLFVCKKLSNIQNI